MFWVLFGLMMAMMWSRHWYGGDWSGRGSRRRNQELDRRIETLEAELGGRDETIAVLESRVNELESRLDFTERLIMQPKAGLPAN